SGTITLDYFISEPASSTITNNAEITALSDCPIETITAIASCSTHILGIPGISLVKTGPADAYTLSTITYTLAYQNTGQTLLSSASLSDTLPDGSIKTFSIGSLSPGQSGSITLDYFITEHASSTINNIATITAISECPIATIEAISSCSTHIEGTAILTLTKNGPATATSGSVITYTLSYSNTGTAKATNLILTDYPPLGFIPIDPLTYNLGTLTPGSSGSVSLSGTVTDLPNSTLTNSAILTGTSICPSATITVSASCTTHIEGITNLPDLIITKIKICPNRPIFEGDRINVVAWVKNIGTALAEDIDVSFLDGTETQGTRRINRLKQGQTKARNMTWRIYPAGTHTIKVIADPDNTIPEIREDNNIGTQTIFVRKRPNRGILMGRVTDDRNQKPLPNTWVIAIGRSFGLDITNNQGKYTMGNLIPGRYWVIAIKCGYIPEIKITPIHSSPPPNILNFELKKRPRAEAEISFDEIYSLILRELNQDKTLSEGIDPEFTAFSVASFFYANREGEPVFLEEPGTVSLNLQREGDTLLIKANLKNISIAKIETNLEIESGDLLKERRANMLRTQDPEGVTGEGILAKLKIEPSEEPITLKITCTFIDAEGNLITIQESQTIEPQTPSVSELLQSFPNPANNGCYIPFKLSADSNELIVEIYNILGQRVKTIEAGPTKAGSYTKKDRAIFYDVRNDRGDKLSQGLYFISLKAGKYSGRQRLVIQR
ncbi:MAG: T9SS type A sorting domain-containing protein, partial [Proteobacteria bacterium]|nr:T9SS type A sorting domain-containing protein [Pseudomonadota bacterium]